MRRLAVALVLASLILGCSSPADTLLPPAARQLVGEWRTVPEKVNVGGAGGVILKTGSYQITLVFSANGDAVVDTRSYGLYGSQRPTDLSAYTTSTGTFRVVGDSVMIDLTRSVWWDAFYGLSSPEHHETLSAGRSSASKFRIEGDRLILDYLSYPADAPVPTTATYIRAN